MDGDERRKQVLQLLKSNKTPISATKIASNFKVSRQIIVSDIALLRASGANINATPRGYVLIVADEDIIDSYVVSCRHDKEMLAPELYTIVDNGGCLLNVIIEHPIYGTITQKLEIRSRFDADAFLAKTSFSNANLLCSLTQNVHMHTLSCPDSDSYMRILTGLKALNILHT